MGKFFLLFTVLLCHLVLASQDTFFQRHYTQTHALGLLSIGAKDASEYKNIPAFGDETFPESFDLRALGGVTPVKDQGSCGSCWAFAMTSSFESEILMLDKKVVDLSEQYLVDCDRQSYGCGGGDFTAGDLQVNPGQPLESEYPYRARNGRCKEVAPYAHLVGWHYLGAQGRSPSVDEIKAALIAGHLVAVDVAVGNGFQSYGGGVLNRNDRAQINHMVGIVGYDEKGKYWIVKNSWGANWGEKGYLRIKYGIDQIGDTAAYLEYK